MKSLLLFSLSRFATTTSTAVYNAAILVWFDCQRGTNENSAMPCTGYVMLRIVGVMISCHLFNLRFYLFVNYKLLPTNNLSYFLWGSSRKSYIILGYCSA